MTFSVVARCPRTGKLGACQTTGTPAVGARCLQIVPGHRAVLVQASIDYRLVARAAHLIGEGLPAQQVMERLEPEDPQIDWRQVAVVTARDQALLAGSKARGYAGIVEGDGFIAAGNMVAGAQVVARMAEAFAAAESKELEERLVRAVEAGRDAGDQPTGQNSAVLTVYTEEPLPIVDLRVDMHPEPVDELRRIFGWHKPLIPYYIRRNADPTVPPWRDYLRELDWPLQPPLPAP